jgi:hypothetical protein
MFQILLNTNLDNITLLGGAGKINFRHVLRDYSLILDDAV